MEHWKLGNWCRQAVRLVRYPPDRQKVLQELRQHIDDRSELFLEQGFSQEEAVEKTLQAMGDADALAPQLAAIHRPFWGFAWSITKYLSIAAIVVMLLTVLAYHIPRLWETVLSEIRNGQDSTSANEVWDPYEMTAHPQKGQRTFYGNPNSRYSDGYITVTLTDAATWINDPEENEYGFLAFRLQIRSPFLLTKSPEFYQFFTAKDSLGNQYTFLAGYEPNTDTQGWVWGKLSRTGLLTWTYDGSISPKFTKDVTWIDICYERDGRKMALRIHLTEVE